MDKEYRMHGTSLSHDPLDSDIAWYIASLFPSKQGTLKPATTATEGDLGPESTVERIQVRQQGNTAAAVGLDEE